jgi:hypothetical protein
MSAFDPNPTLHISAATLKAVAGNIIPEQQAGTGARAVLDFLVPE